MCVNTNSLWIFVVVIFHVNCENFVLVFIQKCGFLNKCVFFFSFFHPIRNVSAPVKGRATNNAGEIQAATRAIRDCGRYGIEKLRINTDSDFLRASVCDRLPRWECNGFCKVNGEPLANRRDFIELSKALDYNDHMDIEFYHVSAHSGDPYNDEADYLAKQGARQYQPRW